MDRIAHCAGSPAMERGLPDLPVEEVAESGTAIHGAMETGDDEGLGMTEKEIAARMRDIELREFTNWAAGYHLAKEPVCVREERFWIRNRQTLDPIASARPDVCYISAPYALVINYKSGFKNPTPSERSWQSRTEVIALWHEHPELTTITGAFLASRLSSKYDATEYQQEDLQRVEREIRHIIWRSEQPDAPRVPGPWCRYCKARGLCRENAVYSLVATHGMAVVTGSKKTRGEETLAIAQAVARMTPQEMGFVYSRQSTVDAVYAAIKARLLELPENELAAAGYEKQKGNTYYPVDDPAVAFVDLGEVLSSADRAQCIKVVIGTAEDLLAARQGITKKEAKERIISLLGLQPKLGNPKLKPL